VDELTLPRGKCGVTGAQEQIAPQQMVTGV
jgi:hypothetical protein